MLLNFLQKLGFLFFLGLCDASVFLFVDFLDICFVQRKSAWVPLCTSAFAFVFHKKEEQPRLCVCVFFSFLCFAFYVDTRIVLFFKFAFVFRFSLSKIEVCCSRLFGASLLRPGREPKLFLSDFLALRFVDMAHVDVEGGGGMKKRSRQEEEDIMGMVVLCDYAREQDEAAAAPTAGKRQYGSISNSEHVSVLDVYVPGVGGTPCRNECLASAINNGAGFEAEGEEAGNKVESSILRELEDCLLVGEDEQVGSSESAVSEENAAARVLRSLEEELGLSESEEGHTAVSSLPSAADEEAPCTAAFATWGDDVWNMHGFSSADLSVGCSSGSTLTGDDFVVCERFDVHPMMLNQENNNAGHDPVDICFRVEGVSDERLDCPSSAAGPAAAEKGRFEDSTGKRSVLNHESSFVTAAAAGGAAAGVGTLEGLHNAISWALEEGFDDYSGFNHMGVGDDWITPEGNLDFLLDSTTVSATTTASPFIEEGVPL